MSCSRASLFRCCVLAACSAPVVAGCGDDAFLDPPPPATDPDRVQPPEPPLSVINVPMAIPLSPLVALVEGAVPTRYGSLDEFHELPDSGGARIAFELERTPFRAVFVDRVARLDANVLYRVRVHYPLPALPDVDSSCGIESGPRPALSVAIESPMTLDRDWTLRTRARIADLKPVTDEDVDRCRVTGLRLDITERIVNGARALLEEHLTEIDRLAAEVDTRSRFASWWHTLSAPVPLGDSLWLTMGPEAIRRGPLRGSGDSLTVQLALRSRPQIYFGPRPSENVGPLPPLETGEVEPRLDLLVDARADYGAAGRFLEETLSGVPIDVGGRAIQVDSVRVFGIGSGRLAMQLRVSGEVRGRIYLTGRPAIDLVTGRVAVPDLELDVATRGVLMAAASWFAVPELRDYMREHATWPTAPAVDWLTTWLERGLNRPISDDLRVEGTVDSVRIVGATALRDALWVRLAAKGSASLFVEN
jgi:hypothetical protein